MPNADAAVVNAPSGFTVRCSKYHPMAVRFPALRQDPTLLQDCILTMEATGEEAFVVGRDEDLPRLLVSQPYSRRVWRTEHRHIAEAKAQEYRDWDRENAGRFGDECFLDVRVVAVPDQQALLRAVQRDRLGPDADRVLG